MIKSFPIDFVRQAFEQTMLKEHNDNPYFFGGKNQVNIFSFYEQLKSQEEVDRFVERYRDLSDQQNRSGLILNGVLVAPENPTITNLYSSTIIPMSWTCSMRCLLENRDYGILTINNLIEKLKGRKVDIAQLDCVDSLGNKYSVPFVVGTIGQNYGKPILKNGDYIGSVANALEVFSTTMPNLYSKGVDIDYSKAKYFYCEHENKIKVCKANEGSALQYLSFDYSTEQIANNRVITISGSCSFELMKARIYKATTKLYIYDIDDESVSLDLDGEVFDIVYNSQTITSTFKARFVLEKDIQEYISDYSSFDLSNAQVINVDFSFVEDDGSNEIIFPPEHTSFEKYKLSFSFDAIRCDEPRNLNEKEYCELSFGGSATLVNNGVKFGNDLLKISLTKYMIKAQSDISFTSATPTYLEPLEMPSGINANTQLKQLVSNNFLTSTQTDAINITLQYTFILDENVALLDQLFNYARYGTRGVTINDISPNMIFTLHEYWCSWGNFNNRVCNVKIVENIDIENTESDTLTLNVTFQIQGEND